MFVVTVDGGTAFNLNALPYHITPYRLGGIIIL